ncbi:MAG: ATP-binding protein [Actinomycetota bacterium]
MKNFLQKLLEEEKHDEKREDRGEVPFVRIAIYDSLTSTPRVIDLSSQDQEEFINSLATKTYRFSQEKGGDVPFTVIKEVIENLIHAYFKEAVISILDNGNTIRISDQGPGIKDKEKAFEPGFSTANREMKGLIKGVGSGLPIVKEALAHLGGIVTLEDNLERGTVVTLRVPHRRESPKEEAATVPQPDFPQFTLNKRQKKVLFLVTELGAVGPSRVASELEVSLSTAYRDLKYLEEAKLIKADDQGKRSLTSDGIRHLDLILSS